MNAAVQDAQDVRQLDLYVSGRVRAGETVLWVGTRNECLAALNRLLALNPGSRARYTAGAMALIGAGGGAVEFVHSETGMRGRTAQRVIITKSKATRGRDGFGAHSIMEAAALVTIPTTKAEPLIEEGP